jgi:ABC-type Fe3+/spermidine/putrescine transport system ATPase subunit
MLELSEVTVRYGEKVALDHATLSVAADETLALLGPSGSGKSTLLRAVAGLEVLNSGQIAFDGVDLASVPTHLRRFGLMFQGYALFPHLTVAENVAFGLRMQGLDESKAAEGLALVGMEKLAARSVDRLSGGEQQRVALARTLVTEPRLMMLDEPVGALDRQLRRRLTDEMRSLLSGRAVIYVTHDHDEANAIADRVALMNEGRIVQVGKYQELSAHPADQWVADFLESR